MQIKIKNKGILDFHLEQTDEKKWELVTNDRSVDITLEWSGAAFTISESDKILIDADDQDSKTTCPTTIPFWIEWC